MNCPTFELVTALILNMSFFDPLYVPPLFISKRAASNKRAALDFFLKNVIVPALLFKIGEYWDAPMT